MFIVVRRCTIYTPPRRQASSKLWGSACMHTLVWPLPHRPVQLGWTCQECGTLTDIALGVIEARKPSHHSKVHAPSDGLPCPTWWFGSLWWKICGWCSGVSSHRISCHILASNLVHAGRVGWSKHSFVKGMNVKVLSVNSVECMCTQTSPLITSSFKNWGIAAQQG